MIFHRTGLADAWVLELDKKSDERGFFARTYCAAEFEEHGLVPRYVQMNTNYSARRGTLRGLHWQAEPHGEAKLVRCLQGEVFDAIADMRPDSPTYMKWEGFHLTSASRRQLYVPPGFAHGFLALTDEAEITYLVSASFSPGFERGARYDDPALGIAWPIEVGIVSAKDRSWADLVA